MVFKRRKPNRLQTWDYHERGPYFVTFCTHHRDPLFRDENLRGLVLERVRDSAGSLGAVVHAACVAEDHVHLLVSLPEKSPMSLSQIVGTVRVRVTQLLRAAKAARWQGRQADPYAEGCVGASLLAHPRQVIWQRSFYDHIIRNEQDFTEKARYIENHPWKEPGSLFAEWH